MSASGPGGNVLTITPTLRFTYTDGRQLTDYLRRVLAEDACRV